MHWLILALGGGHIAKLCVQTHFWDKGTQKFKTAHLIKIFRITHQLINSYAHTWDQPIGYDIVQ